MHIDGEIWQCLSSTGFGGIETQTLRWGRAMQRQGYKMRVILMDGGANHPLVTGLQEAGLSYDLLDGKITTLWRYLRRHRPALVHTRGYKAGILGRLSCRLAGIPVVSHFHNGEPGVGRLRAYTWMDDHTAFLAPAMAVSQKIADRVPAPIKVIDNFVDIPDCPDRQSSNRIAFVGRLSWEKGADAFCALASRHLDCQFDIFGDGPDRASLEAQYPSNLHFHGAVPGMGPYWSQIGLLVMPSKHEGLPNAALEAMAHGIPVAAYGVGGLPGLIRHEETGWIAPPQDLETLSAHIAIWETRSDEQRRAMAAKIRQDIIDRYSFQVALPRIMAIYQQALGGGNGHNPARTGQVRS